MGRFIKAVLVTLSVFAALGCDYLPRSASWPLSDEQTQQIEIRINKLES